MSFDEDGKLVAPAIIMHPNMYEAKKDEMKEWEKDASFVTKMDKILEEKREAWLAREANRKLAD